MSKRSQTVEATGKLWKFLSLVAGLLVLGHVLVATGVLLVTWITDTMPRWPIYGHDVPALLVLGITLVATMFLKMFAKAGAWWFHG